MEQFILKALIRFQDNNNQEFSKISVGGKISKNGK